MNEPSPVHRILVALIALLVAPLASLHAAYFQSLEHLLRYCARPPFALERLSVIRGEDGRRPCLPPAGHPPTGANSFRPTTIATCSKRRVTSCP